MSSYFILTGPGRTATQFLAKQLNHGLNAAVKHDEFLPINRAAAMKRWRDAEDSVIGTVSGTARYYLRSLYSEFKPKIVFLWRDPFDLIKSHVEMHVQAMDPPRDADGFSSWPDMYETPDMYMCRMAHLVFGDLEVSLTMCKRFGIPVHHSYMSNYLKPKGLLDLAKFLGVDLRPYLVDARPVNAMPDYDAVLDRVHISLETVQHVYWLSENLPRVAEGYARAMGPSCVNRED
jgi:hypothetical protein